MSIEVNDEIYKRINSRDYSFDSLYIDSDLKPYLNGDDKEFFSKLGISKMTFYAGYSFNYILDGIGHAIDDSIENYKHPIFGLNSVLLRSLNIRFMKINRRGGNVICDAPWRKLL